MTALPMHGAWASSAFVFPCYGATAEQPLLAAMLTVARIASTKARRGRLHFLGRA